MTNTENKGFVVGATVIFRSRGGTYHSECVITKVYKNGNFILGNKQQYKPAGRGFDGKQFAHPTGKNDSFRNSACLLMTPELRTEVDAEMRQDKLVREARDLMGQVKMLPLHALTEDNISFLRMFVEALQAGDKAQPAPIGGKTRIG